jgi:Ran GTPase-activating protein (RanGAP) involved in mRNA processing and transport
MGDAELRQIANGLKINKGLRVLDLSQNQISNNLNHIREGLICNIALEKLDLSSNMIEDEGLVGLCEGALLGNRALETLAIGFNKYGIRGLKSLFTLFTLGSDFEKKSSVVNLSFSVPHFDN